MKVSTRRNTDYCVVCSKLGQLSTIYTRGVHFGSLLSKCEQIAPTSQSHQARMYKNSLKCEANPLLRHVVNEFIF